MVVTIDTSLETPAELRLYARFLEMLAAADESPQQKLPFLSNATAPAPVVNGPFAQPAALSVPTASLPVTSTATVIPPIPPPPPPVTTLGNAPNVADSAAAVVNPSIAANGCDSTGLPWDERIHSSGENKLNTDGTWRQKRGANPMLVASVTAELRARPAQPQAAVAVPVRPLQVGDILTPVSLPLPVPPPPPTVPVDLPPAAAAPAAVLPAAPAPTVGTVSFTQLFAAANRHGFDNDRLTAIVVKAGGTGLESLVNNPALIAIVYQMVQESVNAQ